MLADPLLMSNKDDSILSFEVQILADALFVIVSIERIICNLSKAAFACSAFYQSELMSSDWLIGELKPSKQT